MRILSLNPHLDDDARWRAHATSIRSIDPEFYTRVRLTQVAILLAQLKSFDVVAFYNNVTVAAIVGSLKKLARLNTRLVLQEMFVNLGSHSGARLGERIRSSLRWFFYFVVAHVMDRIVVHTSAEVAMLSDSLHAPPSRFRFVPYFHYNTADQATEEKGGYVLAIGRHRDFPCFIQAVQDTAWPAMIVAGETDRVQIGASPPQNVEVRYEVSWAEYRALIAGARIVVLPLFGDRWHRSLGQIAAFEATLLRKPLLVADTFHLRDYFRDGEVLRYKAGSPESLRSQIDFLLGNLEAGPIMTARAYNRVTTEFTRTNYVESQLKVCAEWSDPGLSGAHS